LLEVQNQSVQVHVWNVVLSSTGSYQALH